MAIHHISLKVPGEAQFQEAVQFYSQVLACPVVRAWGEGEKQGAMLDLGNTLLEITPNGGEQEMGRFAHIAFATDDVDGAIRRVRAAGRPILVEPKDVNLGGSYPIRVGFCAGPAGEEIEFFQEYAAQSEG